MSHRVQTAAAATFGSQQLTQSAISGRNLLPGAGGVFHLAKFDVVVCCSCGLTRFFAPREAVDKLAKSALWEKP